ncbi:MAG: DUF4338 domain-containing protein [Elusimicrobia bacterium]|nr:DUF4338 domain-containing protein [Elusimicrobiota bacterium]MBP9127995.1 DUF4338 domain-containing protein [Elusimicrobiota bacterium]MBP9698980.1 DUF4338 domain-containing protein [Elusimicrobiota bacterium]
MAGKRLKYLVHAADGRLLATLGWSFPVWKQKPRDRAIGSTPALRRRNLSLIANNNRFLILSWVRVPHLASHILSRD